MREFIKRVVAIAMIVFLLISSVLCVAAVDSKEDVCNQILNETVQLKDNEIKCFAYNISKNHKWAVCLDFGENYKNSIKIYARDCVDKPYVLPVMEDVVYQMGICHPNSKSGYRYYKYNTTGGTYQKVRYKLSQYDHFNEDGSHSTEKFTYRFSEDQYDGENCYSSVLMFVSGGAITFAAPDKDGYVEFYVSTDIDVQTRFSTGYHFDIYTDEYYSSGSESGFNGHTLYKFIKGGVSWESTYVGIIDATWIQMYIANLQELTQLRKYSADVDCNGTINIMDATEIQFYLAELEY